MKGTDTKMNSAQRFSTNRLIAKTAIRSAGGIVSSQSRVASEIGARVMAKGGNAVDAAIATSFALHVCEPWMSGLGGGGGMLIHDANSGQTTTVDFPMLAPSGARPENYPLNSGQDADLFGWPGVKDARNRIGGASIAIPGQVAGMALALDKYGTRRWADLMAPAIELAEEGLPLDWYANLMISSEKDDMQRYSENAELFQGSVKPPQRGADQTRLRNAPLIGTMRKLRDHGPRAFYEGPVAEAITRDIQRFGGTVNKADLQAYQANIRAPRKVQYRDATVAFLPELTGGDAIIEVLKILTEHAPSQNAAPGPDDFINIAGALEAMWQDRLEHAGDRERRMSDACTTHLSVVDADGNVVSMTQTLLSPFGCRRMLPETGLFMNNGMYWFDPRPGRPNSIAPGKRPLGNYSPCLAFHKDRIISLGAAGGRRIIPAVTQILKFMIDHGMGLEEAMHHPRIDVSGGAYLVADPRLGKITLERLAASFDVVSSIPTPIPNVYAIVSAVVRGVAANEGLSEPVNPWSDAVSTDAVSENANTATRAAPSTDQRKII
ncbi:MAG: gamma-glutamyltransferase [Blastopirellula sp.]|nr:MAG: gamma-glutamyltransferase [Blastopirellula sp.]